jgi:hypothetical protein
MMQLMHIQIPAMLTDTHMLALYKQYQRVLVCSIPIVMLYEYASVYALSLK